MLWDPHLCRSFCAGGSLFWEFAMLRFIYPAAWCTSKRYPCTKAARFVLGTWKQMLSLSSVFYLQMDKEECSFWLTCKDVKRGNDVVHGLLLWTLWWVYVLCIQPLPCWKMMYRYESKRKWMEATWRINSSDQVQYMYVPSNMTGPSGYNNSANRSCQRTIAWTYLVANMIYSFHIRKT